MADLKLDEEKLRACVEAVAKNARDMIEERVADMRREIAEAARALRSLPESRALLRDAIGVAMAEIQTVSLCNAHNELQSVSVGLGFSQPQVIGSLKLPADVKVRVLVLILPVIETKP